MGKFWDLFGKLSTILTVHSGILPYWEQFVDLSSLYQVIIITALVVFSLILYLFLIKPIFFGIKAKTRKKRINQVPYDPNKIVKNPFIVGQVVHYGQFFGREQIIQRLFNLWADFPNNPMQNAAIYGEKRIGKTSLLFHLKDLAETAKDDPHWRKEQKLDYLPNIQDYQFIYVTFQNAANQTQQGFLQYILEEMELTENIDTVLPRTKPLIKFGQIVTEYLEKPTVILLDELGVALSDRHIKEFNADFWDGLRVICTSLYPQNLAFVLSAHEPPKQLGQKIAGDGGSPFFNVFGQTIELKTFVKHEAQSLINSSPEPFSAEDIDFILQRSELKPYLLQILCRTRLNYLLSGNHSSEWQKEALKQLDYQGTKNDN